MKNLPLHCVSPHGYVICKKYCTMHKLHSYCNNLKDLQKNSLVNRTMLSRFKLKTFGTLDKWLNHLVTERQI
uniref:Uncharacterized protein n=1 Tax=Arion vulgaris TaxID=1028688 RepID=A0A0B7AH89_9EUPU